MSIPGVRAIKLPHGLTGTPLGAIAGAASVHVPLAMLTPAQAETVEAYAAGRVVITPSRGLVLPGAARHLPSSPPRAWSPIPPHPGLLFRRASAPLPVSNP